MGDVWATCTAKHCRLDVCRVPGRVVLADSYEVPQECPLRRSPESLSQALHALRLAASVALTSAAAAHVGEIAGHGGEDVRLAELVVSGRLTLVEAPQLKPRFGARKIPKRPPEEPPPGPPSTVKTWIGIKVVKDDTSEAVPGVKFRLRLPDGRETDATTRADGSLEIHDIDPGTCDILEMIDTEGWEVVSSD